MAEQIVRYVYPQALLPDLDSTKQQGQQEHPELHNEAAPEAPFFTPVQSPPSGTALDPQPDGRPLPKLFTPLTVRGVTFQNRIFVSPMCQYSAHEGFQTPWHTAHLGGLLQRGPGLVVLEAAAVQARGRITPQDAGIWLDAHVAGLKRHVDWAHSQGHKIGIQLAHAGRKASTVAPWLSWGAVATAAAGGWPDDVVAPSAIAYNEHHATPRALTLAEIDDIKRDFVAAAKRAVAAGFDVIEMHFAHGYLVQEFVSPTTNKRTDRYGGSFENRVRLPLEIVELVRAAIPDGMPLFARINASDWLEHSEGHGPENSWTLADSTRYSALLAERGVDVLDISSASNHPDQKIVIGPAYQAHLAKAIKKAVGSRALVTTVGAITSGNQAEELLVGGRDADDEPLDIIFVGRPFLKNPGLVWAWAEDLDIDIYVASQIGWGFGGRATRKSRK